MPKRQKEEAMLVHRKFEPKKDSIVGYLKIPLVILWVLWAFAQADLPWLLWKAEPFNLEMERAGTQEVVAFYNQVEKEAELMGDNYAPKDYFTDYRRIETKRDQVKKKYPGIRSLELSGYGPTSPFGRLQEKLTANRLRRKFSDEDISLEAQKFNEWKRAGGSVGDEAREKFKSLDLTSKLKIFFLWLWTFYYRSLGLVLLLYLMRMWERRGILETILADKKKFVWAVPGWPVFIWQYPFNIIREIRVEAELRRMGDVFRRFSNKEREFVQKIANSDRYEQWLLTYRQRNQYRFRNGLLAALAVTILITAMAPAFSFGATISGTDPPAYQQAIAVSDYHGGVWQQTACGHDGLLPEREIEIFWKEVSKLFSSHENRKISIISRAIGHVPLDGSRVREEVLLLT